jgi:regulator of protease activity HflC (stomatin/prohibitin superfamily)
VTQNKTVRVSSGWIMVFVDLALYALAIWLFVRAVGREPVEAAPILLAVLVFLGAVFVSAGFFILNPNYAALLVLFGRYKGTVAENGFHWANSLLSKKKISMRVRNQETSKLKVNDKSGNPIEIAAVVVWKVTDAYRAQFEVDNYQEYVRIQSESALRHMASQYAYDGDDTEITLRGSYDEVSAQLRGELEQRLDRAGVEVMESRLAHLAYAPEIASEMLKKQQATAVVAARTKIVEGAVGMVEHALEELGKKKIVQLDEERKATMVSNLLVVLCSEHAATPVVNAGTLYQ